MNTRGTQRQRRGASAELCAEAKLKIKTKYGVFRLDRYSLLWFRPLLHI